MNGLKVLIQALAIMGISNLSAEVKKTGLSMLNVVCEDLGIPALKKNRR